MSNVILSKHPILAEKICRLRNKNTNYREFRSLVDEISSMLLYEASFDLELVKSGT
ncbi:hypothetical protein BB560_000900, partial [Smittium megazygosporum]